MAGRLRLPLRLVNVKRKKRKSSSRIPKYIGERSKRRQVTLEFSHSFSFLAEFHFTVKFETGFEEVYPGYSSDLVKFVFSIANTHTFRCYCGEGGGRKKLVRRFLDMHEIHYCIEKSDGEGLLRQAFSFGVGNEQYTLLFLLYSFSLIPHRLVYVGFACM